MWFKNAQIFQLKDTESLDTNELIDKIRTGSESG